MAKFRAFWLAAFAGIVLAFPVTRADVATNLVFDAVTKEFNAKPGELNAEFDFSVTNRGPNAITINSVRASCGCTTPKMPTLPWKLDPGASGSFHVTTDLRGKFGTFQKTVFMDTTEGQQYVYVKITVPPDPNAIASANPGMDSRTRNMQLAQADAQSIFRGECASCHSKPAIDKKGEQLFTVACGICHESDQRAVLVSDLHNLKKTPTAAYWDAWIRNGKVGTMMPAFSTEKQGPLSNEQIESLVNYLMTDFSKRPVHGKTMATAPAHPQAAAAQVALPNTSLPFVPPPAPKVATPGPVNNN